MKKTMLVRQGAAEMHKAEAEVAAAVKSARSALVRLRTGKMALEVGAEADAVIAQWEESVKLLEAAEQGLIASHKQAYAVLQDLRLRGGPLIPDSTEFHQHSDETAAA